MFTLLFAFLINSASATNTNEIRCAAAAENFVTEGYTSPAEHVGLRNADDLVYIVRTTTDGGDSAFEVTVKNSDCSLLDLQMLWTE